ncbi:hypothetical protein CBR_g4024 [Chara braunii]|uniref:Uncharacterized protein n=1 Tax=Chara braunii TaxID=69332 RepID=A0A388KH37_CHABU|nr:hypothetical protein CBR_g4024 [Chara braunii]|eukprot:GBG69328.1 hypothetical protein CBR_g4024 [Chara braunii]
MEADGYRCRPEFERRRRSVSPQQHRQAITKRSPSEEPRTSSRLDDLGKTVAAMKDFVDLELARREAKEARKREKEAAKMREEEKRVAAEEARLAAEAKNQKKLEKQRCREADREAITKVVGVQVALRLRNVPKVLKNEVQRAVWEIIPDLKGKAKIIEENPSTSTSAEILNAVEVITGDTENLHISEKRKRGEDMPVGDSPPITTPAKCTSFPYPRVKGNMRCRIHEVEGIPELMWNVGNISKAPRSDRMTMLQEEICEGFESCVNIKTQRVACDTVELEKCMQKVVETEASYLRKDKVLEIRKRLGGLVLTPLDRNPGETLVICPVLFYEGIRDLSIWNDGYVPCNRNEMKILKEMKLQIKMRGLQTFVKWDNKGSIGYAYAMPKHKDLERYRPICPTYSEPMGMLLTLLGVAN